MRLNSTIADYRKEHDSLTPPPDAGMLDKTKAKAKQLAIMGKIKLEEVKIGGLDTQVGKQLVDSEREESVRCSGTESVLAHIANARANVAQTKQQAEQAAAALESQKATLCETFGLSQIEGARSLDAAISQTRQSIGTRQKELSALRSDLPGKLLAASDLPEGEPLVRLVNELRQAELDLQTRRASVYSNALDRWRAIPLWARVAICVVVAPIVAAVAICTIIWLSPVFAIGSSIALVYYWKRLAHPLRWAGIGGVVALFILTTARYGGQHPTQPSIDKSPLVSAEPSAQPAPQPGGPDSYSLTTAITADYLPFTAGSIEYSDLYMGSQVLRNRAEYKRDGTVENYCEKAGNVENGTIRWLAEVNKLETTIQYRIANGYVEQGVKDTKGDLRWEPTLKLGATAGETWKRAHRLDGVLEIVTEYVVVSFGKYTSPGGQTLPTVTVRDRMISENGPEIVTENTYVKGMGLLSAQSYSVKDGKTHLVSRIERVFENDEMKGEEPARTPKQIKRRQIVADDTPLPSVPGRRNRAHGLGEESQRKPECREMCRHRRSVGDRLRC
jgi:hypothetical protein